MWNVAVETGERRVLSDQERRDAEAKFLSELESEHTRRENALAERRAKRKTHGSQTTEDEKRVELFDLREDVRKKFYKTNGYKRYTDSTGRDVWLPPAEYDQRMRHRKRRRRSAMSDSMVPERHRTWLLYLALAAVALVLGFALAR
jgi:hypothetical protein